MKDVRSGQIVSFYSFNGGVGRTTTVANLGCLLARNCRAGEKVLVVDWNVGAPTLHRFFGCVGPEFDVQPGLMELVTEFSGTTLTSPPAGAMDELNPDRFVMTTHAPALFLLKAGRFGPEYFSAASSFDWVSIDERAPWLIPGLVDYWRRHYRYVLIDAPSGVSNLSGLCAMTLPDKLVTLFTLNSQSLDGAAEIARCAVDYRKHQGLAPLAIYPLPARVEVTEGVARQDWRFGNGKAGYQPLFESLLRELFQLPSCNLHSYFTDVQIPYHPRYSVGEDIATVIEAGTHKSGLYRAYEALAERVTKDFPWDDVTGDQGVDLVEVEGSLVSSVEAQALYVEAAARHRAKGELSQAARDLFGLAVIEERQSKVDEARSHYQESIDLYRQSGDSLSLAGSLESLAQMERRVNRLESARDLSRESADLYEQCRAGWKRAHALQGLAEASARLGEAAEARRCYKEAAEIYRTEHDNLGQASALQALAELERKSGEESAESHFLRAVDLFRIERDTCGLAAALRSLAEIQRRKGKLDDSLRNYEQAADLYRGDWNHIGLASALHGMAEVERRTRRADEAQQHFSKAIELYRRENDSRGLAAALQGLAELESRIGKSTDAKTRLEEAGKLCEQESNRLGQANALRTIGDLDRRAGRLPDARGRYEESMELYRLESNSLGQANALQSLGDLEKKLGLLDQAQRYYQQAIQLYRKAGSRLGLANTLKSSGDVEAEMGNIEIARDHFEQAIEMYTLEHNNLGIANVHQSLGDLERARRRFKDAADHYRAARDLYLAEQNKTGLAYTCSELARVTYAVFDFGASVRYLEEAARAASETNMPAVSEYVQNVRQELLGELAQSAR